MEIVEKHHRLKLDAPSGTALALADSINEAMDNQYHYIYDRSQRREMRDDKEIGISAVRGGTIVGEHEVIFAGPDEVIEFKHTAYSKAIFGKGAYRIAEFDVMLIGFLRAGRATGKRQGCRHRKQDSVKMSFHVNNLVTYRLHAGQYISQETVHPTINRTNIE